MREIYGVSHAKIGDALKRLQYDHGIKVSILAPEGDKLFRIADHVGETSRISGVPEDDIHIYKGGTHVTHIHDPEGFSAAVQGILGAKK